MSNIIIAGDFVPQNRVLKCIEKEDYSFVFDGIKPIVEKSDYSIVNLEGNYSAIWHDRSSSPE